MVALANLNTAQMMYVWKWQCIVLDIPHSPDKKLYTCSRPRNKDFKGHPFSRPFKKGILGHRRPLHFKEWQYFLGHQGHWKPSVPLVIVRPNFISHTLQDAFLSQVGLTIVIHSWGNRQKSIS